MRCAPQMSLDRRDRPQSEQGSAEPLAGNVPWVDPYTDDVLAQMRAQAPLSATVEELRGLTNTAVIRSAIDTTSNSVTVYWHGPQPAAVNTVVSQALAAGITVNIIDAFFSAAQLSQSRSPIRDRMQELGISRVAFDADGGGTTVHYRTTADIQAASDALAGYQQRLDQITGDNGNPPGDCRAVLGNGRYRRPNQRPGRTHPKPRTQGRHGAGGALDKPDRVSHNRQLMKAGVV